MKQKNKYSTYKKILRLAKSIQKKQYIQNQSQRWAKSKQSEKDKQEHALNNCKTGTQV